MSFPVPPYKIVSDRKNKLLYYPVNSDCVLYHAYWDGTTNDYSSYGQNSTVYGATFVENGLSFDGIDDHVIVDPDSTFQYTGAFTWDGYVKVDTTITGNAVWVGFGWGELKKRKTILYFNFAENRMETITDARDASSLACYDRSKYLKKGEWHHFAYIYNRLGNGKAELYIDTINADTSNATLTDLLEELPGQPIEVGVWRVDNAPTYTAWFKGIIGELRLWTTAISLAQLSDIFNSTKSRYGL
jgi:hypothetical protein